ncbi:MAG: response regulator transcription factor [Actinomycetota bacterium]|nr:response regulator transcription factor [Actinomycetota bacterium]
MRLLVVEDDEGIAAPLVAGLAREGFDVRHVTTGSAALAAELPDVVLLDLRLPDIDGFDVCRSLRSRSATLPILILSARTSETDRVLGLELGADDYVPKPYGLREVIARVRAVLRRAAAGSESSELRQVGELTIDRRRRRVFVGSREVTLTVKEFDLLSALADDPGAVVARQDLLERVWDMNWYGPTKTLDVHMSSLRRKLGDPGLVETVRGVGFRLAAGR